MTEASLSIVKEKLNGYLAKGTSADTLLPLQQLILRCHQLADSSAFDSQSFESIAATIEALLPAAENTFQGKIPDSEDDLYQRHCECVIAAQEISKNWATASTKDYQQWLELQMESNALLHAYDAAGYTQWGTVKTHKVYSPVTEANKHFTKNICRSLKDNDAFSGRLQNFVSYEWEPDRDQHFTLKTNASTAKELVSFMKDAHPECEFIVTELAQPSLATLAGAKYHLNPSDSMWG